MQIQELTARENSETIDQRTRYNKMIEQFKQKQALKNSDTDFEMELNPKPIIDYNNQVLGDI